MDAPCLDRAKTDLGVSLLARRGLALDLGLVNISTTGADQSGTPVPSGFQGIALDSRKSRFKRLACATITSARLLSEGIARRPFRVRWLFITLTIGGGRTLKPEDISSCLKNIRDFVRRARPLWYAVVGLRYVWTMELMKSGAPHYHICLAAPHGLRIPYPDKKRWWKLGWSELKPVRKNVVGYIAKYASKGLDNPDLQFPKGFRTHGASGLDKFDRIVKRWWLAPKWVKDYFPLGTDIRRVVGGFVDMASGELLHSPWIVVLVNGAPFLMRKIQS